MEGTRKAQEAFTQSTGKAVETLSVWADANQRMLKEWVELTSGAAREGLRLYGELQVKTLEGMKEIYARAA